MTEKEYKEYIYEKANKVVSKEDLDILLKEVVNDKELDYGKVIYAISACMLATVNYIDRSEVGGITGLQASFIGWEMIKKLMHESKVGMRLVDYEMMLYPQYEDSFQKTISESMWIEIQNQAKIALEKFPGANSEVIKHWKNIIKGIVPFGYEVVEVE